MYGAVLWRHSATARAVFWCEDQGALAFWDGDPAVAADLQVGDMVQFDVIDKDQQRAAVNVVLIAEGRFDDLPEDLQRGAARAVERRLSDPSPSGHAGGGSANVVSLYAQP